MVFGSIGGIVEVYADQLALLVHVVSTEFEISRTHLMKYLFLAEAKGLFPPLLPNLDHYGVHPVDAEIALERARSMDLVRERPGPNAGPSSYTSQPGGKITVFPSPRFDPYRAADELGLSYAEFERNLGLLIKAFPPRRLSDEEGPERFIPGRGLETLTPLRNRLRDDSAWLYTSARWMSLKTKAHLLGITAGRGPGDFVYPIPEVRFAPEDARRAALRRIEKILKAKESVPRYVLRISELDGEKYDPVDMWDSDALYAGRVVSGPYPAGDGLQSCVFSESILSEDPKHRIAVEFDESGFPWSPKQLRSRKLLLAGRLGWDGKRYTLLPYAAISYASLPFLPERPNHRNQTHLPVGDGDAS